jgi:intein-encoded DNA endonuclease-like protein
MLRFDNSFKRDVSVILYNVYIFGCSHTKSFIRKSISINNININNCYKSSVSLSGFTKEISRLNYKQYVDIIINANIDVFWEIELNRHSHIAVENYGISEQKKEELFLFQENIRL